MFQLNYQSSDLISSPGNTAGTGTSGGGADITPPPGSGGGGGGSNDSSQGSGGLSAGASAGIGVGAAIAVIILAALAIWLFRRRKRGHSQPAYNGMIVEADTNLPTTTTSTTQVWQQQSPEMMYKYTAPPIELPYHTPAELPTPASEYPSGRQPGAEFPIQGAKSGDSNRL